MSTNDLARPDPAQLVETLSGVSAGYDPELLAIIERSALTEVVQHEALDERRRHLVRLAALVAVQGRVQYAATVSAALHAGVTPVEVKEVLYQAVPYLGSAKVVDFLEPTNDLLLEQGVSLPLEPQATTGSDDRADKGLAARKDIIGAEAVDAFYASVPADEMHFQRALSANCFGDHITRSGLDLRTRELLIFTLLVSLGGVEPQAKGHAQANLNVGNSRTDLLGALTQILPIVGYPRVLNGLGVVNAVAPATA
jgi:4-carboxymuconolactone decarboxylase